MRRFVLALTAILIAQQGASAMPSPNADAKGMDCLKRKQYNLAVYHLKGAIETNPSDAQLHYYLANALVHMRRHPEAIAEYRLSYELDPFSIVSGYCRQALHAYNVAVPVIDRTAYIVKKKRMQLPAYKEGSSQDKKWSGDKTDPDDLDGQGEEQESDNVAREPTAHEQHLNTASAMIRRQAADEKARHKQYSDHLADNVVKTGAAKAQVIKADAEERIKELYEGPILYDSQGVARTRGLPAWRLSPILQEFLKQQADQIRREADARAQLEINISHDKSSEYKKWYMQREEDLDLVTESLETQLILRPGKRAGVTLNPIGTGLYVRNYSTLNPKHPIPEARSSVVRILDRGYVDPPERNSFTDPTNARAEVTGRVLYD